MEKEASDAECLLRLAEDGTVSAGNIEGLVSRVIDRTADSSKDDERVRATFLTIYQLFSTSACLFEILKRRFVSADPTDTRSQYSYVNISCFWKILFVVIIMHHSPPASCSSSRIGSRKVSRTKISAVRQGFENSSLPSSSRAVKN